MALVRKADSLQKLFQLLIAIDYILLLALLVKMTTIGFSVGISISLLLVVYNFFLIFFCFKRATRASDSHITSLVLLATILSFIFLISFII
ncbi:hypothetical protein L0B53_15055 [Vibrio sp. SS-MA-C1-2]|uniref:hypothetical protein n=1 Tax=Vibrio sp. SS-MA-C1-2 TaxID=2908646 RepID=UPI001F207784|nr:hypothetical protein [Vibrio sp. SS-MA-C1-2]UJF18326.1 hypothetical protein L0B53_15055 [Vibrio sp. SS-MA-C1-2]